MSSSEGSEIPAAELQYLLDHANDTRVPNVIACVSITAFFSTLFVVLRIIGRHQVNGSMRLHMSDWLVLVGWVFFIVFSITFGLMTKWGGGRHIILVTNFRMLQIMSVTSESSYALSIAFLKFSMLSLYGSIFPNRRFHFWLWGVALFISAATISFVFGTIFQCVPFEAAWETSIPGGHCMKYDILAIVITSINIFTDFVVLILPIPLVRRLQTSKRKKRLVMFTFAIGSSACIVSIIRLVYTMQVGSLDGSWTAIPAGYLSALELTVGFLVVSLPTYRPMYQRIFHKGEYSSNKSSQPYSYGSNYDRNVTAFSDRQRNHHYSMHSTDMSRVPGTNGITPGITITDQIELLRHTKKHGTWVRVPDDSDLDLRGDAESALKKPYPNDI